MRSFVESLSLFSGAILVAIASAGVVSLLSFVSPAGLRRPLAIVVPLIFTYCLYWTPVWLGADPVEYHAWMFLFLLVWGLAGAIPSMAVVHYLAKRRPR
jgi:predicted membrane protein